MSYLTILPDAGTGVFVSLNRQPDSDTRLFICMFMHDLLLDLEPWLSEDDVCNKIKTSTYTQHASFDLHKRVALLPDDFQHVIKTNLKKAGVLKLGNNIATSHLITGNAGMLKKSRAQFEEYTGIYGHYAYGNITITLTEDDHLYMVYGDTAAWDLGEEAVADVFVAEGVGILWFRQEVVAFLRNEDDEITSFIIDFDALIPPTFTKDIDWANLLPHHNYVLTTKEVNVEH